LTAAQWIGSERVICAIY